MEFPAISPLEHAMLERLNSSRVITNPTFESVNAVSGNHVGKDSDLRVGSTFKQIFDTVDAHQKLAEAKITAVELGQSDDLIGATVAAQKAQLSFSALMQVRNKMVSNFNDIIKMQI
ncbi:flagellar hook-basal body complex protein FliE [Vibrio furnissii]|uniref:Flagellar hook-basal body complex protein FliE n=1 Tax=Vibrio furnissii TaxID=29494 RepID=A0A0Q2MBZ8_VIBFU|nr:flagellar hook-basal body complex protein FliE [Vibrio furnissii]EEX41987.1 flagellar hook-basal body complex protein FliE [Vibrio furnissii CIP 102972]KQH85585.1 flagellar hook-basal body protein FliE [Vibrio furnissii]MCG6266327.1 flagellar hook-basal body complex protein FliE [Vibrio furnissii]QDC92786.1 flagellar hook-basal body complex protein FliE [Vibrio furnissii]UHJ61300.1 flagellar hook-basal body complex protein FliE [Vibrio furnissii]